MYSDYSLLIVDDEPLIRENLSEEMKDLCPNIFLAENGEKALEIFAKHTIDVAFVDARMPRMNGVELIQAAHSKNRSFNVSAVHF